MAKGHLSEHEIDSIQIPWPSWVLIAAYAGSMITIPLLIRDSSLTEGMKAMSVVVSLAATSWTFLAFWDFVLTLTRADRIR